MAQQPENHHEIDEAENMVLFLEDLIHIVGLEFQRLRSYLPGIPIKQMIEQFHSSILADHRSFIRFLGSRFWPFQPAGRLYVQIPSNGGASLNDAEDNRVPVATVSDFPQIGKESIDPDAGVRHRCECYPTVTSDTEEQHEEEESMQRMSTPICQDFSQAPAYCSVLGDQSSTVDGQTAMEKIAVLETELAKLREQLTMVVMMKEEENNKKTKERRDSSASSDSGIAAEDAAGHRAQMPIPPPPPRSQMPIPPPPPPPPPMVSELQTSKRRLRVGGKGKENQRSTSTETEDSQDEAQNTVPTMRDVLKDLHKVKLRHVNRTPGGTPKKLSRANGEMPSDAGAFIAEALKKKFAMANSPSSDTLNDQSPLSRNTSWDMSPDPAPLQQRRRSSLRQQKLSR